MRLLPVLVLLSVTPSAFANQDVKKKKLIPAIPLVHAVTATDTSGSDDVAALKKEFDDAQTAFIDKYRAAKTDEERQAVLQNDRPDPSTFVARFEAVAAANPGTDMACEALLWCFQYSARSDADGQQARLDHLLENYGESKKLADLCSLLTRSQMDGVVDVLRKLAGSPHREVQGPAKFALASRLKRDDGDAAEIEKLFQDVSDNFADISDARGRTFGALAAANLFEMKNLSVGMPVPDIEGEDTDGVAFKLSDYRGKVVLIDFWGHW